MNLAYQSISTSILILPTATMSSSSKTYIVEHLDPELESWSALEYRAIAAETTSAGSKFLLSSVPTTLVLPSILQGANGLNVEHRGVEELYAHCKERVCLLDPSAEQEMSPADAESFDVFLFGGILGDDPPRGMSKAILSTTGSITDML